MELEKKKRDHKFLNVTKFYKLLKIQILTDKNSWFFNNQNKIPNKFKKLLKKNLLTSHLKIKINYDITLIISYYKKYLKNFY